jgi:thioredoxin-dependent peroxiredoxin
MKAPDFSLRDQNGQTVTLNDFAGEKLVLYFYPKADTPGCTAQACGLRDHISDIRVAGAEIVGVSPDEIEDLKHFEKKYNLNFRLLGDPSHKTLEAYKVWKEKSFMGRRFMGVERTTFLIDEQGNIIETYEQVNPTTHADMIIARLQQKPQAKQVTRAPAKKSAKKATKPATKKAAKKVAKKPAARKTAKPAKKKAAKKRK